MLALHFVVFFLAFVLASRRRVQKTVYDYGVLQRVVNDSQQMSVNLDNDYVRNLSSTFREGGEAADLALRDAFKAPSSRAEALELVIREILLDQRYSSEKMEFLKDLEKCPEKHKTVLEKIKGFNLKLWKVYLHAKIDYHWSNVLLRWASYCLDKPENEKAYEAFKKVLLDCAHHLWRLTRSALLEQLEGLEPFSKAEIFVVYKIRSFILQETVYDSPWFKDKITTSLYLYANAVYLLAHGDGIGSDFHKQVSLDTESSLWPAEKVTLNDRIYQYLTRAFYDYGNESFSWLTAANIDKHCNEGLKSLDIQVSRDIELYNHDESIKIFEKGYFFSSCKMEVKFTQPPRAANKKPQHGRKGGARGKRNPQTTQKQTSVKVAVPETASPIEAPAEENKTDSELKEEVNEEVKEEEEEEVKEEEEEEEKEKAEATDIDSSSSAESDDKEALVDAAVTQKINKYLTKFFEDIKSHELKKKIIKQEQKEMTALKRLEILRPKSNTSPVSVKKSTAIRKMDSHDFCTAFPKAHELFIKNDGACDVMSGKRYRWIFDDRVEIKSEHMQFLCQLFGLTKKGKLTFLMLRKTFYVIEGALETSANRTVFGFSHRFVINDESVEQEDQDLSPTTEESFIVPKKGIHREHASSRFNHSRAQDLFESAGLDPRFFYAID